MKSTVHGETELKPSQWRLNRENYHGAVVVSLINKNLDDNSEQFERGTRIERVRQVDAFAPRRESKLLIRTREMEHS